MMQGRKKSVHGMCRLRKKCLGCSSIALAILGLTVGTGCNEEEALRTFRDAAASSIQSGVKTIADGIIDGLFAVFQSGTDSAEDTSTE